MNLENHNIKKQISFNVTNTSGLKNLNIIEITLIAIQNYNKKLFQTITNY